MQALVIRCLLTCQLLKILDQKVFFEPLKLSHGYLGVSLLPCGPDRYLQFQLDLQPA
jgi:hypothetical protein